ncbi:MAG: MFS transporter [Elusimicrobiota bacterium]
MKTALNTYLSRLSMFSRNVRLLLLGDLLIGLGLTFWLLLFNLYLKEYGADLGLSEAGANVFIGRTMAISQVAAALFALPAAWLASRFDMKKVLIGAHLLSCLAYAACILSTRPGALRACVFFGTGFCVFFWVLAGPFTMENTTDKERTYVFSLAFTLRLVGSIGGNLLAGNLKELAFGLGLSQLEAYRLAILCGLGVSALAVVPFSLMRGGAKAEKMGSADWGFFGKAILPSALVSVGAGLIVQFMNLFLKDTFPGLKDSQIGLYLSMQSGTMVFGMLLAPLLAEKYGKVRVIVWTQLLSIPFMLTLAFTRDLRAAVVALVIRAALMNMGGPVSNTLVLELCRKSERGLLSALFTMDWNLAWSVSALIYGQMGGDYTRMFIAAVGLYMASTTCYYAFFKDSEAEMERRKKAGPEVFEPV